MKYDRHELEAQINALQILLAQTQPEAIEYLENAVRSIVAAMNQQAAKNYQQEFAKAKMTSEKIDCMENRRMAWREELAELLPLLEAMPDEEGAGSPFP